MENLIEFYGYRLSEGEGKAIARFENVGRHETNLCFYKKNPKKKEIRCYCPTNDEYFEMPYSSVKSSKMSEATCPNMCFCEESGCKFKNADYPHKGLSRTFYTGYFEKVGKGVVFRGFDIKLDFEAEYIGGQYDEDGGYPLYRPGEISATEVERVFLNDNGSVEYYSRYVRNMYSWCITRWRKVKFTYYGAEYLGDMEEDLKGMFAEGLTKYVQEISERYSKYYYMPAAVYSALWRYAGLRRLVEYGFYKAAFEYIDEYLFKGLKRVVGFNLERNTIKGVLNVEPNLYGGIVKEKLSFSDLRKIRSAYEKYGIRPTGENVKIVTYYCFSEISDEINEPTAVRKLVKYIRRQNRINSDVDFGIYYDYYLRGKFLKYDFANKVVMYPPDLMRAHDRTVAISSVLKSGAKTPMFVKAISRYRAIKYSDNEKYIEVISTPTDLNIWAKKFGNCSAGYCDRIISKRCVLFLVRLKAFPEYPYCMFELNGEDLSVVQVRGKKNRNVDDRLRMFIEAFSEYLKENRRYAAA